MFNESFLRNSKLIVRCNYLFIIVSILLFYIMIICISKNVVKANEKAIFYVSTTGNDSNSGSISKPFKTIQHAVDIAQAGETVVVRGGIYFETVDIRNKNGNQSAYITIKAFAGETPILDGKNIDLSESQEYFFMINKSSYIKILGFEMRNLYVNDPDYYPAGVQIYNGSNNIEIRQNHIHHLGNKSKDGNAHGIIVYGNSSKAIINILIKENDIHHLLLGSSEALTVSGNVSDFNIVGNKVHDNNNIGIDIAGFYEACTSPCDDQARNGRVDNNTVYNNSSANNPSYEGDFSAAGIYADGSTNILIQNNTVYSNDFGVSISSEQYKKTSSFIKLLNNNIRNNRLAGLVIGGSTIKNGGAYKNVIQNNIFRQNNKNKDGFGEITIQQNTKLNVISNNIFYLEGNTKSILSVSVDKNTQNSILKNTIYKSNKKLATYLLRPWDKEYIALFIVDSFK